MQLTKWKIGRTEGRDYGLVLIDGDTDRVVSLVKDDSGSIKFTEECDGYFSVTMSKEDAKQALLEALAWIDDES